MTLALTGELCITVVKTFYRHEHGLIVMIIVCDL